MVLVEQPRDGGQACGGAKRALKDFAVGVMRMVLKVALATTASDIPTSTNTRQPHLVDEVVVLHEPHEHAREHPRDRALDE